MVELQWKEIETEIADAMDRQEKAMAQQEYQQEVEKINWENIEKNLKAQYEKVDWQKINLNLNHALNLIQLDSLSTQYSLILTQLEKSETEIEKAKSTWELDLKAGRLKIKVPRSRRGNFFCLSQSRTILNKLNLLY